jgi:hypothetical protein
MLPFHSKFWLYYFVLLLWTEYEYERLKEHDKEYDCERER